MMKKIILSFAAAAFTLAACSVDPIEPDNSSVSLSQTEIISGPEGGDFSITVTSGSDWRVSGYSEWVTPTSEGGKNGETLTFKVGKSDTKEARTAEFKVFSGSATAVVKVVSKPEEVLVVAESAFILSSDASRLVVKLETNVSDLKVTDTEWVMFAGREVLLGEDVVIFDVAANDTYKDRDFEIVLSGVEKTEKVKVSQAQLDAVIVDDNRIVHEGLEAGQVKFTVRANVDYTYKLPDWLTLVSETKGTEAANGLTPIEYVLSFEANAESRIADINFERDGEVMLQISVKQQRPGAVIAPIADKALRKALLDLGWVLSSDASADCEILGPGLEGTQLRINSKNINEVSGLGAFPKLANLEINGTGATLIDLSDCKTLQEVYAPSNTELQEVKLGSSPVTKFSTNIDGLREKNYFSSSKVTVSSENLKELNLRSFDCMYLYYYDACTEIDVSACPALTYLDAYRIYTLWGNYRTYLTTIYVSQAQLDAYNAGNLEIVRVVKTPDHHEEAALVVK